MSNLFINRPIVAMVIAILTVIVGAVAIATLPDSQAASFADLKWWEVFRDEELQGLIKTALEQNYDLRGAVTRIEMARANLGITRSDQFPQISAGGDVDVDRLSRNGAFPLPPALVPSQNRTWGEAQLNLLTFEVDLWGRLRRATEAARASLLSAEENRKAVITTLVSNVATQYFTLREFDVQLEIARQTLATRQEIPFDLTAVAPKFSGSQPTWM